MKHRIRTIAMSFVFLMLLPAILLCQEKTEINQDLFDAAKAGNLTLVDSLLRHGANANSTNERTTSCLMIAAIRRHAHIVELLVESGADVNYQKRSGGTALSYACANGDTGMVKFLIRWGAEVSPKVRYYSSPLFSAINRNKPDVLKILIEHGADVTNALNITSMTTVEIVRVLISEGAEVNQSNSKGQTPLIKTVMYSNPNGMKMEDILNISRVLLENGADVTAKDNDGRTALIEAVNSRSPELIKLLLDHGADKSEIEQGELDKLLNRKKIPSDIIGWWINKSFYEDLQRKVSPNKAETGSTPFLWIRESHKIMVTSLSEGWYRHIEVENDTLLHMYDSFDPANKRIDRVNLHHNNSGIEISINDSEHSFVPYPKKYGGQPPRQMINDLYFAGTYTIPDSMDAEVTLSIDGRISGYRNMETYTIGYGSFPPDFDTISLRGKNRAREYYHWKFDSDTLLFYNYEMRGDDTIGDLHLKLVRKR